MVPLIRGSVFGILVDHSDAKFGFRPIQIRTYLGRFENLTLDSIIIGALLILYSFNFI